MAIRLPSARPTAHSRTVLIRPCSRNSASQRLSWSWTKLGTPTSGRLPEQPAPRQLERGRNGHRHHDVHGGHHHVGLEEPKGGGERNFPPHPQAFTANHETGDG